MRLIYLHGLRSDGSGTKPDLLRTIPGVEVVAPTITEWHPHAILEQVKPLLTPNCALAGSSMGGFMALHLATIWDLKAALFNPVVRPEFVEPLDPDVRAEFAQWGMSHGAFHSWQIKAWVAIDDDVVNPQMTVTYLGQDRIRFLANGGHRLDGVFASIIPEIAEFLDS